MKALIISGDLFEDTELLVPLFRLKEEHIDVDVASIRAGTITGKHGYMVPVHITLDRIDPSFYDLMILPGGKAPAVLRKEEALLALVRSFFAADKPVAAICHGPQVLVSAGVLAGRRLTCYAGMAEELKGTGADYRDAEVVVDGNLITARIPADLPAFCREIVHMCRVIQGTAR